MLKSIFLFLLSGFSIISFSQNNPPVANPGGDYTGTKNEDIAIPVTLHAYDSYDPDMPDDEIVKYCWDTDNDGLFGADDTNGSVLYSGESDAEGVEVEVVCDWYTGNSYQIHLVVEDSHGARSSVASTALNIVPYSTAIPVDIINLTCDADVSDDGLFKLKISHPYADAQVFGASFFLYPEEVTLDCFDEESNPITQFNYQGGNIKTEYDIYFNSIEFADGLNFYRIKVILSKALEIYEVEKTTRTITIDNTHPIIICPDNQVRDGDESNKYITYGTEFDPLSATDNFGDPSVINDINLLETLNGYSFGPGTTTITWTAEDLAGNTSQCSFDIDVSFQTSTSNEKIKTLNIYPNPVGESLTVDPGNRGVELIILFDTDGRIVKEFRYGQQGIKTIDISGLKQGLYTIFLKFDNKEISTQKVIISK